MLVGGKLTSGQNDRLFIKVECNFKRMVWRQQRSRIKLRLRTLLVSPQVCGQLLTVNILPNSHLQIPPQAGEGEGRGGKCKFRNTQNQLIPAELEQIVRVCVDG